MIRLSRAIKTWSITIFLMTGILSVNAQVVTTSPAFPTLSAPLTITFDASEGNAGLDGFSGSVYAHTGVITDKSTSNSDWKYVQGTWGTSTGPLLTSIGGGKYTLSISDIEAFYSVPNGEVIEKIAILFRNEAGSKVGRASDGGDIFIDPEFVILNNSR